jgi:tRNA (pseudouridine54-N1)-methyltransferase
MKTFIIRARKGTTDWKQIAHHVGDNHHIEIVAHCVMNAFFISNGFRQDVEVYIVLESSHDFPRTLHLVAEEGLSLGGFHEAAILSLIEKALKESIYLKKDETQTIQAGVSIHGFGFEKLVAGLLATRPVYLLEPKGSPIKTTKIEENPVFILSDHLSMPDKIVKSFKRKGAMPVSLGKTMLFASQCIVLLHAACDEIYP